MTNRRNLAACLRHKGGMSKDKSEQAVSLIFKEISDLLLCDEKITLAGFGVFDTRTENGVKIPFFIPSPKLIDEIQ
ncbi:HU family DNA-binding protein [Saccharibacillus deserti]|uniref:HU family DNA-binding protein n=1 Tax=Saccharibacillus deserti TaxID=1634444 RepID=UPI00155774A1|nr:HU family DNA-binding protein [Saccharibacillus deserti]